MEEVYIEDGQFEKQDFRMAALSKGTYECCTFINCDFGDSDLSMIKFVDCEFNNCNLSMAKLVKTSLQEARFISCKMLGLRLEHCSSFLLSFSFQDCLLDHASFYQLKIKGTRFTNCRIAQGDFTECDLTGALFDHTDLTGSIFDQAVLEKADMRTAFNYSINPERSRIRKAKFSAASIAGLLDHYDIIIE